MQVSSRPEIPTLFKVIEINQETQSSATLSTSHAV